MKKLLLAVASALLLLNAANLQAKELRSAGAAPEGSPWGQVTNAFSARVAELSGGKLTIKHFHGSQLGDEQTTIRQVARGRLDMGFFSNTASSLLVPEYALLASPFAFKSLEQADCVADKHLLSTYGEAFDKAGVQALAWAEIGYQIIFSKKMIKTPADLAGVKIRTAPTKTDTLYIEGAGGNAVPLGTTDSMPALKTGNVSAATWPTVYGIAVGYHKVADQVTVTNHVHQIGSVVISNKTWNNLSEEEQAWLKEAAVVFKGLRKAVRGAQVKLLEKIAAEATVYTPTDAEDAEWRAVAPKVQEKIVSELGGDAAAKWAALVAAKSDCE